MGLRILISMFLYFSLIVNAFAQEAIEDKNLARFDQVIELLQNKNLTEKEQASLLYEKATLMFATFGPLYLRAATESLLEAIKISPDKKEYKKYLAEAYDYFWKSKDLSGSDKISIDLTKLRNQIKETLNIK